MTQNNERELFESMARQRGWSLENSEGEYLCDYTRIGWIAWRERAISQNEQQEAVEALRERDRLGFAVVEVIGKLDEIIEVAEDIEFNDFAHMAIPLELWNELKDALDLMPERADNYTSPPKQIPDGLKLISDELPITGIRVLIYTDGVDFNGEQYFDVQSDSLNECFYESRDDMPEVCIHATHWMPLPEAPTTSLTSETNTEVGND